MPWRRNYITTIQTAHSTENKIDQRVSFIHWSAFKELDCPNNSQQ